MEPFLALVAELWWAAPVAAGGAAGVFAVRRHGTVNGKRLGYDAARLELREAQRDARLAADAARVARADAARLAAERASSQADGAALASARRALRDAQLIARAATARVKATRVRVSTERSALSSGGPLPLEKVGKRHDAVLARWMEYETDPARVLAFPAMSDGRAPATAAFLAALERARDRRPSPEQRVTPAEFSDYRRAVEDLERFFDIAERSARGESVQPDLPEALWDAARTFVVRSTDALNRTSDAISSWNLKRRKER